MKKRFCFWYVSRLTSINFTLLAISQSEHWKGIAIDSIWFFNQLASKINQGDWIAEKQDVAPFLKSRELAFFRSLIKEFLFLV